jgi:hypothetical protein
MSDVIYISNARLSFPHLAEPQRQVNEQTGKERVSYNVEIILPADHAGFVGFQKRYGELALEKWKEHATNVMNLILTDRKTRCFGRGEEKVNKKTFLPYDGYAGNMYITAGRDSQPQVIDEAGRAIDPTNTMLYQALTRKMYGGCRVNVAIKPWLQDNKHGRGVRCDLVAVQFAGDDTPFGEGATDASAMFGAVSAAPAMPAAPFAMPAAPFAMPSFMG